MNRARSVLRRLGKWVGYPFFFLFCLFLFAYWTFPYDRVKAYIIQEVERPMGPGDRRQPSGFELEIVDLSPSWFTGVDLTGVRVVKLPEEPDDRPVDVTFESIHARVGLFALLTGTTSVDYEMRVAGGTIEGHFEQSEAETILKADIAGVRLRRVGLIRGYAGLPVQGTLDGEIDVTVGQEAAQTSGSIELEVDGLKIGDGNAKLALEGMPGDGVTVDQLNAGDLDVRAEITDGNAVIQRLQGRGEDLELDGEGSLRLMQPLLRSRIDILVRAKIMDSYRERSDRTQALFALLEMNPRMRAARTEDGALQYRIQGQFGGRIQTQAAGRARLGAGN